MLAYADASIAAHLFGAAVLPRPTPFVRVRRDRIAITRSDGPSWARGKPPAGSVAARRYAGLSGHAYAQVSSWRCDRMSSRQVCPARGLALREPEPLCGAQAAHPGFRWLLAAARQPPSPFPGVGRQPGPPGRNQTGSLVERLRAGYEPRRRWLRILLRGLARWPLARTTARSVTDGMHRLCRATAQRPQNAIGRNNGCAHSPSGNGCPAYTVYNA